jgi:hypothetical protein
MLAFKTPPRRYKKARGAMERITTISRKEGIYYSGENGSRPDNRHNED